MAPLVLTTFVVHTRFDGVCLFSKELLLSIVSFDFVVVSHFVFYTHPVGGYLDMATSGIVQCINGGRGSI